MIGLFASCCSLVLAIPDLDAHIKTHIDERCEDVGVFLQQSDVLGTIKALTHCVDVELGKGLPFDFNYLPEPIPSLLSQHHKVFFNEAQKGKMQLRSHAENVIAMDQDKNSDIEQMSEHNDGSECEFDAEQNGDEEQTFAQDVLALVDGVELPTEKDMEGFEAFFAEYFGKK
jgi:hypothetical protein